MVSLNRWGNLQKESLTTVTADSTRKADIAWCFGLGAICGDLLFTPTGKQLGSAFDEVALFSHGPIHLLTVYAVVQHCNNKNEASQQVKLSSFPTRCPNKSKRIETFPWGVTCLPIESTRAHMGEKWEFSGMLSAVSTRNNLSAIRNNSTHLECRFVDPSLAGIKQ